MKRNFYIFAGDNVNFLIESVKEKESNFLVLPTPMKRNLIEMLYLREKYLYYIIQNWMNESNRSRRFSLVSIEEKKTSRLLLVSQFFSPMKTINVVHQRTDDSCSVDPTV